MPPRSRGNRGSCCVALCANKLDLGRRAVSRAEGEDFAASHGMRYFETSAATGEQVTEAGWSMWNRMEAAAGRILFKWRKQL